MEAIKVEHLVKAFDGPEGKTRAVSDISFSVEKGEIFGVIGLSGAGKSTLVRCLNLLEKPDSGNIYIDGVRLNDLKEKELTKRRQKIGMIFQNYNLLMQRTVLDNVCFPMEIAGIKKRIARKKALEYLNTVGLSDKAKAYPATLSGGQRQRVAIARALAATPDIILCDEATTETILKLLKQINKDYNITVVLITHEMRVIEEICDRVLVLEEGKIAEMGEVKETFLRPQTEALKRLLLNRQSEAALSSLT